MISMFMLYNLKNMNFSRFPLKRIVRYYCAVSKNEKLANEKQQKKYLVPRQPVRSKIDPSKLPPRTKIDADTIALLERLSLVDCANKQGIQVLEEAIAFADKIQQVDTSNTEPLITVLQDYPLRLREDIVTEGNCRDDILKNAALLEEEYFVAPPGNIPLEDRENLLYEDTVEKDKQ